MNLPALTHHDIVRLVEPFARAGRLVDLAASDRAQRRIHFRPREWPAGAANTHPPCCETLTLECRSSTYFELLRTLTPEVGPPATVLATGPDPGELLARVDAVPVAQLFSAGPGWRVARSYDTQLPSGVRVARATPALSAAPTDPAPPLPPLVLNRAELHAGGLTLALVLKLPGLRSVAADLTLLPTKTPTPAHASGPQPRPALPEDLLAVLGWDWARLVADKQGWTSRLRLRGNVLRRSRTAEKALDLAGMHLARVMAAAPAQFHDEHRWARWGVVLRRGLPTLTAVVLVLGALLLTRYADRGNTGMWMALHYVPIALLALAFSLQELAQFEIPPLPRRLAAPGWWDD